MNDTYKPFSERYGYAQPKLPQREGMDKRLRTGLWNAFCANFPGSPDSFIHSFDEPVIFYSNPIHQKIFVRFLKNPIDEYVDNSDEDERYIKEYFLKQDWNKVLDLVDFIIQTDYKKAFVDECNIALSQENSAYRIVDKFVMEITSEQERTEIETALQIPFDSARGHLEKALALFSDRENPDFENSIKESISAVESIAKEIIGKEKSLNAMTQSLKLHANLTNALNELYDWTSKDGIRHGKSSKPLRVDQDTARFMLVTCSAFVNYIVARNPKGAR